jgi:TetR/AcrR family transcriptional regulator, transcriptional repressor for nem operon
VARPREFDEERAVDAAMRAFWANGYEATSTEDLCAATGMRRSSIYNAFTSKRALFETALARYMAEKNEILDDLRDGDDSIRDKIRRLFRWTMDRGDHDHAGCLVRRDYALRRDALKTAFEAGQRRGEIDPGKDPGALADFVIATISGIRVADRGGADKAAMEAVAETVLGAL